jgi:hypothetical protein
MYWFIFFTYFLQLIFQDFSSNGFSSSRTSKVTFVDLASLENDELDGAANHCTKEERHLKKSLSKLGYVNNSFIQIWFYIAKLPSPPEETAYPEHI